MSLPSLDDLMASINAKIVDPALKLTLQDIRDILQLDLLITPEQRSEYAALHPESVTKFRQVYSVLRAHAERRQILQQAFDEECQTEGGTTTLLTEEDIAMILRLEPQNVLPHLQESLGSNPGKLAACAILFDRANDIAQKRAERLREQR